MKNLSTLILRNTLLFFATLFTISALQVAAQITTPQAATPTKASPRITQAIDEANLVPMKVKVHALARAEFDRGIVADSLPMNRLLLMLKRSPEQETALQALLDAQQTKNSPSYHAWLTPAQFGLQFGVADADVQKITAWLTQKGFTGVKVAPGQMFIEFNGTAGLVRNAFHTEIHNFMVKGEAHMANVSVPQMPTALAPVITGIHSLHNFQKKSFLHNSQALVQAKAEGKLKPGFGTGTGIFAMGPGDFATIYNVTPSGLTGAGQTIAIVARSNINVQDIIDFRTGFGLPNPTTAFTAANNIIVSGADPGIMSGDDEEATLDVEWSSAVAPAAKILLVVADSQATGQFLFDGVDYSAFYIVTNNLAPIVSESFGACEAIVDNQFEGFIWEQAAAQGITAMVSTGDNGSAGCDPDGDPNASTDGLNISGTASTPFNVAVGGTDFDDAANPTTFWNNTAALATAKSYIPEIPWNDTCASGASIGNVTGFCTTVDQHGLDLVGGSGGPSSVYAKPPWQPLTLAGMPNDGSRDIPDVSLFAAANSPSSHFYIICYAGIAGQSQQNGQPCNLTGPAFNFTGVGGTSASTPAFAGIVALVNQSEVTAGRLTAGEGQGNINYVLYPLAAAQATSPGNAACNSNGASLPAATCTFNDVTKGNNSVACDGTFSGVAVPNCSTQTANTTGILLEGPVPPYTANAPGWSATTGYDLATGLGSVNVTKLAANWGSVTNGFVASSTALSVTPAGPVSVGHGATVNFNATVTPTTGTGTPTGDISLIAQPASGQVSLTGNTLTAGTASLSTNQLPGGTYSVIAHYAGDGTFAASDSTPISVTVSKENSTAVTTMFNYAGAPVQITSAPYGSLYLFRVDILGTQNGDNVVCETSAAPCPTGTITVTDTGNAPLNDFLNTAAGISTNTASLNSVGFMEDRLLGSTGLTGGAHSYTAKYSGDNSYNASTAPALAITITPAATLTTVTANGASTATVTTGQSVTLLATVEGCAVLASPSACNESSNGAGPTGSVTFSACGTATSCTKTVVPVSFANSGAAADAFATASLTTTFTTAGLQTITASFASGDTNYSSCPAGAACENGSAAVTVNAAGPAAKLAFTTQPSNVGTGASITPAVKVAVEDASGATVTTATNAVTIAIGNNAGPGGTLSGTLTANAVAGVATFSNLSIDKAGTGYTLTASAASLTSATSTAFNVTTPPTFAVTYPTQPTVLNSATGTAVGTTVTVTPSGGFTGQVVVTAGTLPSGVTCPNSPLMINVTGATAATGTLNCQVTATSSGLSASNIPRDRMLQAKTQPTNGANGWWALSAGTGFAALFLIFLPGGRKRFRAALGLGLACLLSFSLGCSNNGSPVVTKTATTTKMTVTNAGGNKVAGGTAFTFTATVTGGTPTGMVQLFDGATAISTAGASATVSNGTANLTWATTAGTGVGTHQISVHYLGDSTTLASASGSLNLTITGNTTIAITTTPAATPAASPINITVN